MEILNSVWTALSTENEGLIKIVSIPLFFIEIPLIMYMFIYTLDIHTNKKQRIVYIGLSIITGIICSFVIPTPFNVIINYGMMFLLIFIIFKLTILKSFIAMIIPSIAFALINVLISNPFLLLLNITQEQLIVIPIYKYLYSLCSYFFILIIDLILKNRKVALNIIDELDNKNKLIIFTNLILGLLSIISQLIICYYYLNILPLVITIVSFIALFVYFGISIYSLTRIMKLVITTQELESAEAYNKSLSILHDNVRGFKHDFDNIVATIGGYVKTEDMEGLKKYYSQLEEDCQKVNNIATLNPNIINNPGIFNLLSSKYHEADSKHIKINLEIFLDLNTLNMKIYEFSRVLGILLDNAIEEASKCDEKIINIKFRNEHNKNRQVVIVENTYSNKNVDIDEIFNKGYSGKENHSGLGLWEVRQVLKKNNNLNLYTSKDDKLFKQQLEIYY